MSEEIQEYEYVFVRVDEEPTNENNLLASPVLMSTGEANFVNKFLIEQKSDKEYKLLSKDISNNDKS